MYPTETFYGLGASTFDEDAVKRIYEIKKRAPDKPLTVLVSSLEELRKYVRSIPPLGIDLISRFWPGPLTLILKASRESLSALSPKISQGNSDTLKVGFRISSHPIACHLAQLSECPITATSANISGEPPVTRVDALSKEIFDKVDLVLDSGETPGGNASTLVDMTIDPPKILRKGALAKEVKLIIRKATKRQTT